MTPEQKKLWSEKFQDFVNKTMPHEFGGTDYFKYKTFFLETVEALQSEIESMKMKGILLQVSEAFKEQEEIRLGLVEEIKKLKSFTLYSRGFADALLIDKDSADEEDVEGAEEFLRDTEYLVPKQEIV